MCTKVDVHNCAHLSQAACSTSHTLYIACVEHTHTLCRKQGRHGERMCCTQGRAMCTPSTGEELSKKFPGVTFEFGCHTFFAQVQRILCHLCAALNYDLFFISSCCKLNQFQLAHGASSQSGAAQCYSVTVCRFSFVFASALQF